MTLNLAAGHRQWEAAWQPHRISTGAPPCRRPPPIRARSSASTNPRVSAPDFEHHLQIGDAAADHARRTHARRADIRYGAGPRQLLDIFPSARASAPVNIFFHGGFWRALSKDAMAGAAPALVDAGITCVQVGYDLCPAVTLLHDHRPSARGGPVGASQHCGAWKRPDAALHLRRVGRRPSGGHDARRPLAGVGRPPAGGGARRGAGQRPL
ncbi:MAG: hypothetical protein WDO24_12380 [Pseudomonadota bacterium]